MVIGLCFLVTGALKAQQSTPCKVAVTTLKGSYEGGCKNGLAQGKGSATGTDMYTGSFRQGLPHGKGIYTWASGDVYDGQWNMGQRDGEGTFSGKVEGRDSTLKGIWKADRYAGPKPVMPAIIQKYNVTETNFVRAGEGNKISIQFLQNGMQNNIEGLEIVTNSGMENLAGRITFYYDIQFPFHCRINYRSWNSLRTIQYNCTLEFEIAQPGSWELRVVN
jgi:hypothetical protein